MLRHLMLSGAINGFVLAGWKNKTLMQIKESAGLRLCKARGCDRRFVMRREK
jgi:hypothetical protein